MLDVTPRAEQEILRTLEDRSLVGIWLRKEKNQEPEVRYVHHFVGNQNHICGESLEVGVCLLGNTLGDWADTIIDWNNGFVVSKTV